MKKSYFIPVIIALALGVIYLTSNNISTSKVDIGSDELQQASFLKGLFQGESKDRPSKATPDNASTTQTFKEQTFEHKAKRLSDPVVEYSLRVPNGWETVLNHDAQITLGEGLLQDLDIFRGPIIIGSDRAEIVIQAKMLEHEILAEHWIRDFIFKSGYTLHGEVNALSEKDVEASIILVKKGLSFESLMRVFIDQNRAIIIRADMPMNITPGDRELLLQAVRSFKLDTRSIATIENRVEFSLSNLMMFEFPESWIIKDHTISQRDIITAELHNLSTNRAIQGLLHFRSYRIHEQQTLDQAVKLVQDTIRNKRGVQVDSLTHALSLDPSSRFNFAFLEKYDISFNAESYDTERPSTHEMWVVYLGTDSWFHVIYLLTPSKDIKFQEWARNTRTFDLLINSIN